MFVSTQCWIQTFDGSEWSALSDANPRYGIWDTVFVSTQCYPGQVTSPERDPMPVPRVRHPRAIKMARMVAARAGGVGM